MRVDVMRVVLEPRCPNEISSIDFDPHWNVDNYVSTSKIEHVQNNLNVNEMSNIDFDPHWNLDNYVSTSKTEPVQENLNVFTKPLFSMSFEDEEEVDELYLSDDESDEFDLCEDVMIKNHETEVKENIRDQVSILEKEILHEIETYRSAIARVEKYREARKEVERKLDLQYKRRVANKSKTEERKTRRIMERAHHQEEKIRQEEEAEKEAKESGLRLKKLEELEATNQWLKSRSNSDDFRSFEKDIARSIRQISGTEYNVTTKTNEIVKIFNDIRCPLSISIATFAKKIVYATQHPFALSKVIVNVTSQFPQAMDILLAELHKACSYTVPKHDANSELAWEDSDAYNKRIDSMMRLYGALIQTDIRRTNIHGIEHGWAWFNRFLNNIISANDRASATALNAFLQTAGFSLHQSYKSRFLKVLNVVKERFLANLKVKKDSSDLQMIITEITAYLDYQMYLKEPEGRTMPRNCLSAEFTAQVNQQNNNHHYQRNYYYRDYY